MANFRVGTTVNLNPGGTYDLLALTFSEGYPEGKLGFDIYDTPRKITGIQKVAQTFIRALLTRKGSDIIQTWLGTDFIDYALNSNRTGLDPDLYNSIAQEIKAAESQAIYILNTTDADTSSSMDSVSILGIDTTQKDAITIFLKIVTLDGEMASVAIPFPQLNLDLASEN